MRKPALLTMALMVFVASQSGCGSMCNLCAFPGGAEIGPSTVFCSPFGGVTRSAMLGGYGTFAGPCAVVEGEGMLLSGNAKEGFRTIGSGVALTGAGLVSIVDTPLSLAGDVLTMPIAHARQQNAPWAAWWGIEWTDPAVKATSTDERSSGAPMERLP
jgi:uncharacterized protein YceK